MSCPCRNLLVCGSKSSSSSSSDRMSSNPLSNSVSSSSVSLSTSVCQCGREKGYEVKWVKTVGLILMVGDKMKRLKWQGQRMAVTIRSKYIKFITKVMIWRSVRHTGEGQFQIMSMQYLWHGVIFFSVCLVLHRRVLVLPGMPSGHCRGPQWLQKHLVLEHWSWLPPPSSPYQQRKVARSCDLW